MTASGMAYPAYAWASSISAAAAHAAAPCVVAAHNAMAIKTHIYFVIVLGEGPVGVAHENGSLGTATKVEVHVVLERPTMQMPQHKTYYKISTHYKLKLIVILQFILHLVDGRMRFKPEMMPALLKIRMRHIQSEKPLRH